MKKISPTHETLDVNYFIRFIKKHWFVIALCSFVSLAFAYAYNKYSVKVYEVSTSVVINEESGGLADASAQLLNEFGFISNNKSFANELLALKSTPLISETIEKLDFQISYFEHELLSKRELYKSSPFIIILDKNYQQPISATFYIKIIDNSTCEITMDQEDVGIYSFVSGNVVQRVSELQFKEKVDFDKYIYSDHMRFKILLNSSVDFDEIKDKKYSFYINTNGALVRNYKRKLEVIPPDLEATVAEIKLQTENPVKAIDFLNTLTDTYVNRELERKRHTSVRTIEYINDQLEIIGDSLARAEQNLQSFKTRNEVTDISMQSGQFIEEMRELESQKAILNVNTEYYVYVKNYFNQNKEFNELIAPSAMGINDPMLNNLIEELIRLNSERVSFIENNQGKSPYLKKINIRIENLRKMVSENISYYEETNAIKLADLNSRISRLNSEIRKLPATQRTLIGIERKFNVNDAIYTYLLEKRAEAEIAKASYQPDTEIIEPSVVVGSGPISPKKTLNYMIALFLGLFIPAIFIRIKELTQTTFSTVPEAESNIELPVLCKISNNNKGCENVVERYPQTQVSENFRHLNVSLKYFFKDTSCKTILVSSSVGGEGKSFVALNSAITFANSGYKTILLAFDLRKNQFSNYLADYIEHTTKAGLTEFISQQASIEDVVGHTKNKNLDVILSGELAPNPSELISSDQTTVLFEKLKEKYDYILVDTSPIGLISDGYHLINHCDLSIMILRMKISPKSEFKTLQQDLINKGIKSCVVLNDIAKLKKDGYGYYDDRK